MLAVIILSWITLVSGHGRLLEPPSRASAWRFGFNTSIDYNDNEAFCGGLDRLWQRNEGKCGICGDPWDQQTPRAHEIGGVYGEGVIVRSYEPGQFIPVVVDLTASHRGFWELRLCVDHLSNSEDCFEHVLKLESGVSRYYPGESGIYELVYRLPVEVDFCDHCVLSWWYVAGNNWGVCEDGSQGLGCGQQEYFRACADVTISTNETSNSIESWTEARGSVDINSTLFSYVQSLIMANFTVRLD